MGVDMRWGYGIVLANPMFILSRLERRFKRMAIYSAKRYIANCAFPWHMGIGERGEVDECRAAAGCMHPTEESELEVVHEIGYNTAGEGRRRGWSYEKILLVARRRTEAALGRRINWREAQPAESPFLGAQRGYGKDKGYRKASVATHGGLKGGAAGAWVR